MYQKNSSMCGGKQRGVVWFPLPRKVEGRLMDRRGNHELENVMQALTFIYGTRM